MTDGGGTGRLALPEEIVAIATRLEAAGYETWCVGGAIRDALLGHPRADVDLATAATPPEVQRVFRRTVPVGLKFGTVGVLDRQRRLHEVTTFRRDVVTDGRHAEVEYGVSLEDDLARRDLTINAIAYHPLRHEWRDPFGGIADLRRGVVRAVGDPGSRFREDYLRVLRAIRFAARLEFEIDQATWDAARAAAPGLARLSAERVRDEWFASLATAVSLARLVELWHGVGAAPVVLPELLPTYPLAEAEPRDRDPVLLTALLCATPAEVLARLRASNAEQDRVRRLAGAPTPPQSGAAVAVRRWLAGAGPAADDVIASIRLRTGREPDWADTVTAIRRRGDPLTRAALAVTGEDLLAAGVPSGPEVGRILSALLDLVLDDPDRNRRDALLAHVAELRGTAPPA